MNRCQHCGQGAMVADAIGPVCPDCIEEGYYTEATPSMTNANAMQSKCPRCKLDESYGCSCTSQEMVKWQADRIDALEAALREIRNLPKTPGKSAFHHVSEIEAMAEAALGGVSDN